jgi:AdoMet-dependent rRNA methyltransferase SPB1
MKNSKFQTKYFPFPTSSKYQILTYLSHQLERLNAESAARAKRERRRANEIKSRTIQRMQLQMTAPLDIGMNQEDSSLGLGQDDVFDLGRAEEGLRPTQQVAFMRDDDGDIIIDSDDQDNEAYEEGEEDDEDGNVLELEEEREKKMATLEAEMDGLYDAYQDRLRERDAKYKVKESRRKNAEREEWHGIGSRDIDQDLEESDEEGGWEKMQQVKSNDETSSVYSTDDSEEEDVQSKRKRRKLQDPPRIAKRQRLISKLDPPKTSVAARVWFAQDVFTGVNGLDDMENLEDEDEENFDDVEVSDGIMHIYPLLKAAIKRYPQLKMTLSSFHKTMTAIQPCGMLRMKMKMKSNWPG